MRKVYVRGSNLVILSYFCFLVFLLRSLIELAQGHVFDGFYLVILFFGLFLFMIGKWKSKRDKSSQVQRD